MKKSAIFAGIISGLMMVMLLTGCGSSAAGKANRMATEEIAVESAKAADISYEDADYYNTEDTVAEVAESDVAYQENAETQVQDTNRKLIRNVDMTVETEAFDELLQNVQKRIASFGGYVESSDVYNGSGYYDGYSSLRSANLTARIPAEKLDEFLSLVSEMSNVTRKNESVTDVTLQYVDMQSHKEALLAEQKRLLELMEQAESIDDIISLESRLSEVRYQIESMESQLRTFDNQVSYSTVYLYVEEVKKYTPVEEPGRLQKMTEGFVDSLHGVGNGFLDFCIGFVIVLPYLVVWAIVIALLVWIVRLIVKRSRKKQEIRNQKRQEEFAARQAAYEATQKQKGTDNNGTV